MPWGDDPEQAAPRGPGVWPCVVLGLTFHCAGPELGQQQRPAAAGWWGQNPPRQGASTAAWAPFQQSWGVAGPRPGSPPWLGTAGPGTSLGTEWYRLGRWRGMRAGSRRSPLAGRCGCCLLSKCLILINVTLCLGASFLHGADSGRGSDRSRYYQKGIEEY